MSDITLSGGDYESVISSSITKLVNIYISNNGSIQTVRFTNECIICGTSCQTNSRKNITLFMKCNYTHLCSTHFSAFLTQLGANLDPEIASLRDNTQQELKNIRTKFMSRFALIGEGQARSYYCHACQPVLRNGKRVAEYLCVNCHSEMKELVPILSQEYIHRRMLLAKILPVDIAGYIYLIIGLLIRKDHDEIVQNTHENATPRRKQPRQQQQTATIAQLQDDDY